MTRLPPPAFLVLALCAALLLPGPTSAGAEEPAPSVRPEDVPLLPLTEVEWIRLQREHPELLLRLQTLGRRAGRIRKHLEERKDPGDAAGQDLAQQLERTRTELAGPMAEALAIIEPWGITREVLSVLDDAPTDPLRVQRQGIRVVLAVPELTAGTRALMERLVPATDGALLALEAQRIGLDEDADDGTPETAAAAADTARRIQEIQKRFWRVVDALTDDATRRAIRRRLPTALTRSADVLGHVYTLPDLTTSQANRVRALLARVMAEAAPDNALRARLQQRLAETPSADERREIERERRAMEARLRDVQWSAHVEGLEILTEAQVGALRAVPPLLAARERPGDLKALIGQIRLHPEQRETIRDLYVRYGPVQGELAQELAAIEMRMKDYGPDSPEAEMVEAMRARAVGGALAKAREAAAELFGEVLTHDQILTWVLTP